VISDLVELHRIPVEAAKVVGVARPGEKAYVDEGSKAGVLVVAETKTRVVIIDEGAQRNPRRGQRWQIGLQVELVLRIPEDWLPSLGRVEEGEMGGVKLCGRHGRHLGAVAVS
jgi:hypothetical protein